MAAVPLLGKNSEKVLNPGNVNAGNRLCDLAKSNSMNFLDILVEKFDRAKFRINPKGKIRKERKSGRNETRNTHP